MKKSLILTLGLFVVLVGFMSCGGGTDDEARKKAILDSLRQDSILKASEAQRVEDSLRQDSLTKAMNELDSLNNALKNAPPSKGKSTPKTNTPTTNNTGNPNISDTKVDPPKDVKKPVLTGKDAIKGATDAPKSGKDALKGTTTVPKSGKDALKGGK